MRKEIICIGVVVLFLLTGLSVASAVGIKKEADEATNDNLAGSMKFIDNFDDNIIDTNLWTELYSDGIWKEDYQMAQFELKETHEGPVLYEGIESKEFECPLPQNGAFIVMTDFITYFSGASRAGTLHLEISNGDNWIHIAYYRFQDWLYFLDSTDEGGKVTTLAKGRIGDGKWTNQIQVHPDKYRVMGNEYNSGWVKEALFDESNVLKIRLYINIQGYAYDVWRAGFDNVKVANTLPPEPPTINGPVKAKSGEEHTYTFVTNDPEGDALYYLIDWGDGTDSGWKGQHGSGKEQTITHKWLIPGDYKIKIKAKDVYGAVSDWNTYDISMPKTKMPGNPYGLFFKMMYRFPLLQELFSLI